MRVGTSPLVPRQNNFVKNVCFNEILTTCLIDTGSSHVLVRVSLVKQTAATVRWVQRPLYTVGDAHQQSAVTLGETTADIAIDGALGTDHPVLVVSDESIPVDVIVGRSWLELPHVHFYKLRDQVIIESISSIDPSVVSETATVEMSEIQTALVSADQPPVLPILSSDINIDAQASETERRELLQLINKYRDVFAKSLTELGCTPLAELDIVEVDGSVPVRQAPYRTSPSDRRMISDILNEWRTAGIISDSTSPYASPVLLVDKGGGEKRLCVDYRRLNLQTQDQPYPMPDIDDFLSRLHEGVLYRRYAGRLLLVVPRPMRKGIVIGEHDYGGHFSLDRTIAKIMDNYWFPGMKRYVKQHIQMCLDCLVHKTPAGKKPGYLHPIPPGRRPFEVIHVHHLGPFETSTAGNRYLFVLVDNLTKFTHLYPCRSTDTASVLNRLDKFCGARGIPDRIISDRGSCFTGKAFKTFCDSRGIKHTLNSTRHPQANEQVERVNRTIVPLLSIMTEDQVHWDDKVPEVERHLNSAVNK